MTTGHLGEELGKEPTVQGCSAGMAKIEGDCCLNRGNVCAAIFTSPKLLTSHVEPDWRH